MSKKFTIALLSVLMSGVGQAADLELAFSEATAIIDLHMDSGVMAQGGADFTVGGLFNEDDDIVAMVGLMAQGSPAGQQPYTIGIGGKAYFAALDKPDASIQAVALGAKLMYFIPANIPLSFGGEVFFAPGITTFGDGNDLLDARLRFEVDVLPSASIFFGYRNVNIELENGAQYDVDEFVHLGLRIQF
ncbi:MAG TPA: hypothetical protein ENJ84_03535 [Gammaproteobacteria bacterium]|nr:hypothetical protein [Gammaproteobacteria bacterium]